MIELNQEQKAAYTRYIRARDKVRNSKTWVPLKEYICTVDVAGLNHPLFELNEVYIEMVDAFMAWLAVEPKFREEERMRAIRGDYGNE